METKLTRFFHFINSNLIWLLPLNIFGAFQDNVSFSQFNYLLLIYTSIFLFLIISLFLPTLQIFFRILRTTKLNFLVKEVKKMNMDKKIHLTYLISLIGILKIMNSKFEILETINTIPFYLIMILSLVFLSGIYLFLDWNGDYKFYNNLNFYLMGFNLFKIKNRSKKEIYLLTRKKNLKTNQTIKISNLEGEAFYY